MSETARDLLRSALTAKLAVELHRPHHASAEAEQAGRYAARLIEELAGDRARGTDAELGGDPDDDDNAELEDLLAERYPPPSDGQDDQPAGPT